MHTSLNRGERKMRKNMLSFAAEQKCGALADILFGGVPGPSWSRWQEVEITTGPSYPKHHTATRNFTSTDVGANQNLILKEKEVVGDGLRRCARSNRAVRMHAWVAGLHGGRDSEGPQKRE